MTGQVADKARNAANMVSQKAEDATYSMGSCMTSFADTVREHLPKSGVLGSAGASLASTLDKGGRYLQREGLKGVAEDVTGMIRRNPIPAILVGFGLGAVLASITMRR